MHPTKYLGRSNDDTVRVRTIDTEGGAAARRHPPGKFSGNLNTVILATAHPSKFSETVMKATGIKPDLPENLKNILVGKEKYEKLPKDLKRVQNYILERA